MGASWAPKRCNTVTPNIIVDDAEGAIAFLKKGLGFTESYRLLLSDGTVSHCELNCGDSVINLGSSMEGFPARTLVAQIWVQDSDSVFKQAVAAGAKIMMPMTDMFFGSREGRVEDPYGNSWTIATLKNEMPADEMQRRMKELGY